MAWQTQEAGEFALTVTANDGSIRIQHCGERTIRLERSRPDGTFCDDETFTVVARPQPTGNRRIERDGSVVADGYRAAARLGDLVIAFPSEAAGVADLVTGAAAFDARGTVWSAREDRALGSNPTQPDLVPHPNEVTAVWALHDHPRVIPPSWGATAPPTDDDPTSGWRVEVDAFDVYLIHCEYSYRSLRSEVLKITGRPPVPPRWACGFWYSRYYPYTEDTALEAIDEYRRRGIPLDVFVLDTDWRVGGSRGYDISTEHFPDMERFLQACAARAVSATMPCESCDRTSGFGIASSPSSTRLRTKTTARASRCFAV